MTYTSGMILKNLPQLRRYAIALVGEVDKADDLLQEAVLRAIQKADRWQPGTNLRAWLFTIMHNLYIDERRKFAARPRHVDIADHAWKLPSRPSQDGVVNLRRLEVALQALPEEQRVVLLLVGLQGFSYTETSEIVGVPIGTVRSRLSRGRETLRQTLEEYAEECRA